MARLEWMPRRRRPLERVMTPREEGEPFFERVVRPFIHRIPKFLAQVTGEGVKNRMRTLLMLAGLQGRVTPEQAIAMKYMGALAFLGIGFVCIVGIARAFGVALPIAYYLLGAAYGALIGYMAPDVILNIFFVQRRQHLARLTLPDMVDLMATAVEAGLGLDAAIARVATRFRGPLGDEFQRVLREISLGRPRSEALLAMCERLPIEELHLFIRALLQADRFGLPLTNVLRVQAEQMRELRFQRAREQAQRAPVKLMLPLVLFIFPTLFIVIAGPAIIRALSQLQQLFGGRP
ncbi:MAG: type II secretion system F family protein [Armatimonadota bacterium]|nr:type II secretion system F family protein [Armatimonadota bacterium]MCX7777820.1 type II secretion system F family protein [Armatimonadota bacterium]MDW8025934.1 type II secretion system F family protein [Armatimonadota bacterium]